MAFTPHDKTKSAFRFAAKIRFRSDGKSRRSNLFLVKLSLLIHPLVQRKLSQLSVTTKKAKSSRFIFYSDSDCLLFFASLVDCLNSRLTFLLSPSRAISLNRTTFLGSLFSRSCEKVYLISAEQISWRKILLEFHVREDKEKLFVAFFNFTF